MLTQNETAGLPGADVYDGNGDKIGSVGQIFLDVRSGEPAWATVKTGLFGTKETFVPLQQAAVDGDRLTVAVDKDTVKGAPKIDTDGALEYAEENELYTYYGLYTTGETASDDRATGRHPDGDGDGDAMTRSEERLVTGTRTEQAGKARLRKYVVTEQQEVKVPVSREEVRLEREPITEANRGAAVDGPDIAESEHEVTLHAERPVVDTEAVPVERVRLGKETVTDEERVGGEVRKEQIDFDGPDDQRS
jgi:uncharacterized protein (TIGR02271 family)